MTNLQKKLKQALDQFEYQEPRSEEVRTIHEKQEPWYSFKLSAIKNDDPMHRALSDVMQDSGLAENYTYSWAVKAIELMIELEEVSGGEDEYQDLLSEAINNDMDFVTYYDMGQWMQYSSSWAWIDEALESYGYDNKLDTSEQITIGMQYAFENYFHRLKSAIEEV